MQFKHTHRPGFLFGLIDFCTIGLFFLFYMPLSGLQDELDEILGPGIATGRFFSTLNKIESTLITTLS